MEALNKIEILSAVPLTIVAEKNDDTCRYATFLISVLDEYDRMDRMIPYESGVKYHETLRGFPIVAKLLKNRHYQPADFGGHEMKQWKNRKGDVETTFGTYPIGSVVDTWIEEREVAGYEGVKNCIMAKAKLWTCRSPEYFTVFDKLWEQGKISSSWELITSETEEQPLGKRILKVFSFIGNAVLGSTSIPAVKGAGVYEYAEMNEEDSQTEEELTIALLKDIEQRQEDEIVKDDEKKLDELEVKGEEVPEPAAEPDEAAKTPCGEDEDKKDENAEELPEEKKEDETEAEPTEDPEGEEPEKEKETSADTSEDTDLKEKVAYLTEALVTANDAIQKLSDKLAALEPIEAEYKAAQAEKEKAEHDAKVEQLKQMALDSRQFTEKELAEDEAIMKLIADLDENSIKTMIADRLISSIKESNGKQFNVASFAGNKSGLKRVYSEPDKTNTNSGENIIFSYINK